MSSERLPALSAPESAGQPTRDHTKEPPPPLQEDDESHNSSLDGPSSAASAISVTRGMVSQIHPSDDEYNDYRASEDFSVSTRDTGSFHRAIPPPDTEENGLESSSAHNLAVISTSRANTSEEHVVSEYGNPSCHINEASIADFIDSRFRPEVDPLAQNPPATSNAASSALNTKPKVPRKLWNPTWLTAPALVVYFSAVMGIFATVLGLTLYSRAHSGLLTGSESLHYFWTYFPTAIFVLFTSIWARVDFFCKELTPWNAMSRGLIPADRSIMLDYVDTWIPIAFWRAIKYRHWPVVLSITVDAILKLCTVLSSGLLILKSTELTQSTDSMVTLSTFSAASLSLSNIGSDPVDTFFGIQARGLPPPYGTKGNLTIQTFDYTGQGSWTDLQLTANVLGFSVSIECEQAQIGPVIAAVLEVFSPVHAGLNLIANISDSTCQIENVVLARTVDPSLVRFGDTSWNYQGNFDSYPCNTGFDYNSHNPYDPRPVAASPDDYRFLLTMAEATWTNLTAMTVDNETIYGNPNWTISRGTAMMCKPSFSIDQYKTTLVPSQRTLQSADLISNTAIKLAGFNLTTFIDSIVNTIANSTYGQGGSDNDIVPVPPMFELFAGLNNNSRQEALIDPTLLQSLSVQALQGIGTQFAELYLKQEGRQLLIGSISGNQQRLMVKTLSAGLLLGALGLIAIIMVLIAKCIPWDSVPCNTESIASAATILSSSQDLRVYLQMENPRTSHAGRALVDRMYHTIIDAEGNFVIQPVLSETSPAGDTPALKDSKSQKKMSKWWKPIATRKWFITVLLLLPLALIAILEVIQQLSDRNKGISTVSNGDFYHLAVSYIPVSLMLLVSTIYHTLYFTIFILAPFFALRRGNSPAQKSISTSFVSKLPPQNFYISIMTRNWIVLLTTVTAIMSSFLTIIASGLYSPYTVQVPRGIQMLQQDIFDFSHVDLSLDDNLAGITTKLITMHNLSYPVWTFEDLVFPSFTAQIPDAIIGSNDTLQGILISIKLPAVRPSLDCTVASPIDNGTIGYRGRNLPYDDSFAFENVNQSAVYSYINSSWSWSLGGVNDSTARELGSALWSLLFLLDNSTNSIISNTQIGIASPILWLSGHELDAIVVDTLEDNSQPYSSLIYPTVLTPAAPNGDVDPSSSSFGIASGIVWGSKTDQGEGDSWTVYNDMVVAICYQVLEEVQTTVTFNWPDMATNELIPPDPDESSARVIMSNDTSTPTWFMKPNSMEISSHWFAVSLGSFQAAMQGTNGYNQTLDSWFTALQDGKDGQPLSEMFGQANQANLVNASNRLYARYAVQAINANMRVKASQSGQSLSTYNATFSLPAQRLKQNLGPKIALQVIMGIMVVCGALTYHLVNIRTLLQQSPCSIAGRMALLARSELCNTRKVIPKGAEWWNEIERREQRLFHNWNFSLGWWSDEVEWYGVDVVRAEKEEKTA